MLPHDEYLEVIDRTPLVSIDLIIQNSDNQILLGKRTNEPAKDTWFVPGGVIRKNERMHEAMSRLSEKELGFVITPSQTTLLGVYEHLYDSNFALEPGIDTHYVVIGHKYTLPSHQEIHADEQHECFQWWNIADLLSSPEVHENTKAYFTQ